MPRKHLRIEIPFTIHARPHLRRVLRGVEAYASEHARWQLLPTQYFPMSPLTDLVATGTGPVDGLIAGVPTEKHLRKILARGIPSVLINCHWPAPPGTLSANLDYDAIARSVLQRLDGLRQAPAAVAFFGSTHPERAEHWHYQAALKRACAARGQEMTAFSETPPDGDWAVLKKQLPQWARWLGNLPHGTAVVCADDEFAGRAYVAAEQAGRAVGEDLLLLGLGNEALFCEALDPTLSSVRVNFFQLGWEAAKLLDSALAGRPIPRPRLLLGDVEVIARASHRPQRSGSLRLRRALARIHGDGGHLLTVAELAQAVGADRHNLNRLFQAELGHSPSREIARARIAQARQLLRQTNLHLAEIAAACGYNDQAHFTRRFKEATGQTPGRFRSKR
jgi:LacI family transcriptional regulator